MKIVGFVVNYNVGYPGCCVGLGKEAAELQTNAAGILFYRNKHRTIRRQDNFSIDPSSHRIILKIVGFVVNYNLGYPGRCVGLGKEAAELQTNAAGILFGVTSAHSESIQRE